jgi:hypothetical protein
MGGATLWQAVTEIACITYRDYPQICQAEMRLPAFLDQLFGEQAEFPA